MNIRPFGVICPRGYAKGETDEALGPGIWLFGVKSLEFPLNKMTAGLKKRAGTLEMLGTPGPLKEISGHVSTLPQTWKLPDRGLREWPSSDIATKSDYS